MSEMLERVARAMYDSSKFVRPWDHPKTQAIHREYSLRHARAALEALREPTDEILLAGVRELSLCNAQQSVSVDDMRDAWRKGIDSALSPQPMKKEVEG